MADQVIPSKTTNLKGRDGFEHLLRNLHYFDPSLDHFAIMVLETDPTQSSQVKQTRLFSHFERDELNNFCLESILQTRRNFAYNYLVLLVYSPITDCRAKEHSCLFPRAPRQPSIALMSIQNDRIHHLPGNKALEMYKSALVPNEHRPFRNVNPVSVDTLVPYIDETQLPLLRGGPTDMTIGPPDEATDEWFKQIFGPGVRLDLNPGQVFNRSEYNKIVRLVFDLYNTWINNGLEDLCFFDLHKAYSIQRSKEYLSELYPTLRDWMNFCRSNCTGAHPEAFPSPCLRKMHPPPDPKTLEEHLEEAAKEQGIWDVDDDPELFTAREKPGFKNGEPVHVYNMLNPLASYVATELGNLFLMNPPEGVRMCDLAIAAEELILEKGLLLAVLKKIGSFSTDAVRDFHKVMSPPVIKQPQKEEDEGPMDVPF